MSVVYIYVLELNKEKFYVGKTTDIAKRFIDHKSGKGSAWTKMHGGCKLIDVFESKHTFDEEMCTLEYMNTKGINNVRGGSYSTVVLTSEQYNNVVRSIRNANDLCMSCGESGHFANVCSKYTLGYERHLDKSKKTETNINLDSHANMWVDTICGTATSNGTPHSCVSVCDIVDVHNNKNAQGDKDIINNKNGDHVEEIVEERAEDTVIDDELIEIIDMCTRCLRTNHTRQKCYAKSDIYGNKL